MFEIIFCENRQEPFCGRSLEAESFSEYVSHSLIVLAVVTLVPVVVVGRYCYRLAVLVVVGSLLPLLI